MNREMQIKDTWKVQRKRMQWITDGKGKQKKIYRRDLKMVFFQVE